MKKQNFSSCQVRRKALVSIGTFNIRTGEVKLKEKVWKVEKCDVPLFNDKEIETGVCTSCASGWSIPENFPVNAEGKEITKAQLN